MPAGSFHFEDDIKTDAFNLKPKDVEAAIPEDQREISHEVYEARNVLKLLQAHHGFKKDDATYDEFIKRVVEAAEAGCVINNVKTRLAAGALNQIRCDIVQRKGRRILYRYLSVLGRWALGGIAAGGIIVALATCYTAALAGYG